MSYLDKFIIPGEVIPPIPDRTVIYLNLTRDILINDFFRHYFFDIGPDSFMSYADEAYSGSRKEQVGQPIDTNYDMCILEVSNIYNVFSINLNKLLLDFRLQHYYKVWDVRTTKLIDSSYLVEIFFDPSAFKDT